MDNKDIQFFSDLIRKIVKQEMQTNKGIKTIPATVLEINNDGTADVRLATDGVTVLNNLLNKTGEVLSVFDSVYVYCINENLTNAYVGLRKTQAVPLLSNVIATKSRTFTITPSPPYDVGDLWTDSNTNKIRVCTRSKSSTQSYSIDDWSVAAVGFTPKIIQLVHSSNVSITPTGVALPFQTETYKDDIYSHLSNESKIYILQSGLYRITHNVTWFGSNTSTNILSSQLRKNGTELITGTESKTYIDYYNVREYETTNNTFICPLNANDYIEVFCMSSGSVVTTETNDTSICIELIK